MAIKLDWRTIEDEYLSTNMTIEEVADKYDISVRTVSRYSAKHGWQVKREAIKGGIRPGAKCKVDDMLDDLIDNVKNEVGDLAFRNKEGALGCLIKLFELEIKRKPRTASDIADLAVAIGVTPTDFLEVLSAKWEIANENNG